LIILGQRIQLDPNNVQATFFERCAGAARFVYNWGLARWKELYEAGEKPSWQKLNADLNARKAAEFPWMAELPWKVTSGAVADLGVAFTNFFRRVKASSDKRGYPRFKSKKRTTPSFVIEGRALQFDGKRVKIPKLGWVRTRQEVRFPGKVLSARFTKRAGHWYVSLQVEVDESLWSYPHRCETQAVVGIDRGLVNLAVLSTGERIAAPRSLRLYETKLRRLNKELSRRTKGGKNWHRTKARLARLHERIANIRRDVTHKLTASLVRRFRWIGVEDLNVRGMTANRRIAKSVMDAAMAEVGRQLAYKAQLAGGTVVVADRFYPSSKTCSTCGVVYADLALGERRWTCDACGTGHDRDVNAAKNLEALAAAQAVTACRHGSAGAGRETSTKLPLGQESGSVVNLG
jgi:putative transposase